MCNEKWRPDNSDILRGRGEARKISGPDGATLR